MSKNDQQQKHEEISLDIPLQLLQMIKKEAEVHQITLHQAIIICLNERFQGPEE